MALPSVPPKYASWAAMLAPIREGDDGWPVYALQDALVSVGRTVPTDGAFGPRTHRAVRGFQGNNGLEPDGIAGVQTQRKLIERISHKTFAAFPNLPDGLLRGYAEAEGANILAATNWFTPAGGRPGVDCGVVQWRQYGPPFEERGLKKAFSCEDSFAYATLILLDRIQQYRLRRPILDKPMLLRIAVLAHNAPFLSEQIVRTGSLSTPTAPAMWTTKPGGGHYTHREWLKVYPDRIMRYVP